MRSGPMVLRSPCTYTWSDDTADRGGSVPQRTSTRRSCGTTVFAFSSRKARRAGCFGAPSASGPSSPTAVTGPNTRNSIVPRPLSQVDAKWLLSAHLDGAPDLNDRKEHTHDSRRRHDPQPRHRRAHRLSPDLSGDER